MWSCSKQPTIFWLKYMCKIFSIKKVTAHITFQELPEVNFFILCSIREKIFTVIGKYRWTYFGCAGRFNTVLREKNLSESVSRTLRCRISSIAANMSINVLKQKQGCSMSNLFAKFQTSTSKPGIWKFLNQYCLHESGLVVVQPAYYANGFYKQCARPYEF